jgi:AcrR family transcriptional regulator
VTEETEETEAALSGLRERKKELTRQQISNTATGLFQERGFEQVTVAEVARAANVSTKTVFNYFPRKEDLYFDRGPEAKALISRAVQGRAPDETTLRALWNLAARLAETRHPLGHVSAVNGPYWRTVLESPTLRARLREAVEEAEAELAELYARAEPAASPGPWPAVKAAATVSAFRAVYGHAIGRILAGEPADAVDADYLRDLRRAFQALETAFDALGR